MIRAALRVERCGPRGLLAVIAVALVLALPAPAGAQDTEGGSDGDGAPASARLTVTGLAGVLGPGSSARVPSNDPTALVPSADQLEIRALVENDGQVPLDSLRLVVEVYPAAESRGSLRRALLGEIGAVQPLHVHDPAVRNGRVLAPGQVSGVQSSFERRQLAWSDAPTGGVHPVRIAVQRGTDVLDEVTTAVVWLNSPPRHPLLTTLAWPLQDPPWRGADLSYPSGAGGALDPGGRLDVLLRTLERFPAAPVVLAPSAHLLEDLADRSDGFLVHRGGAEGDLPTGSVTANDAEARAASESLTRIREVADRLPFDPIAGPYADADLSALVEAGPTLRRLAAEIAAESRRRVQLPLGREVDHLAFLLDAPLSPDAVELIPGEALLLPYTATTEPGLGGSPSLRPAVRPLTTPSGRILTALVADPYLEDALDAAGQGPSPVITAQRVVAESAMAYLEAPGQPSRALLLLPPGAWNPSPQTAQLIVKGLQTANWLKMTTPGDLVANGRRGDTPVQLAAPATEPFDPVFAIELRRAAEGLDAVVHALPDDEARIAGRPAVELREALLRATSRWYRGPLSSQAHELVRAVREAVDRRFGEVAIVGEAVTLTSDRGTIPVTLQRTRGGPIRVAVEVESQGRLLWPEGRRSAPVVLTDESSQTVSFSTRALSTGTFPVTVRVIDPSGARELARAGISVRSNAVSEPALAVIGGIVVLLLGVAAVRRRGGGPAKLHAVE